MSDNRRHQVFVSSTFEDLKEERKKIYEALMQIDCIPAGMELFGAVDEEQFEFIKTIIDDSDYYVVIVGGRYGTLTEEGISYTEKEYLYAKEKGIPVCALIHGEPESIPSGKTEKNSNLQKLLKNFKQELSNSRLIDYWNNSDDISSKVLVALTKTIKRHPRPGWIRGNKQASKQILEDLTEANRTISLLTEKLNNQKIIQETDLQFRDVFISYEEPSSGKSGHIEINLGTVLLTTSATLAFSPPLHIYRQSIEAIVRKSKNIPQNTRIEIHDADFNRIISMLYAKKIINAHTEDRPDGHYEYLKISDLGREVLSRIA